MLVMDVEIAAEVTGKSRKRLTPQHRSQCGARTRYVVMGNVKIAQSHAEKDVVRQSWQ